MFNQRDDYAKWLLLSFEIWQIRCMSENFINFSLLSLSFLKKKLADVPGDNLHAFEDIRTLIIVKLLLLYDWIHLDHLLIKPQYIYDVS